MEEQERQDPWGLEGTGQRKNTGEKGALIRSQAFSKALKESREAENDLTAYSVQLGFSFVQQICVSPPTHPPGNLR